MANPSSGRRRTVLLIAVVAVFALGAGAYAVGRDMAHRDNARAHATR